MIEVKNLTKAYGDRIAVSDLSFSISKGEVVGLLGPNGAGKSTTMKAITGSLAPTHGQILINGKDISTDPIPAKSVIGYLPETPPVYGDMRVRSFLKFVAQLKGVETNKLEDNINYAIEKTQLGDVSNRMIQNLSKGFQQRVGIAQALVNDPEILILDEPTVGLDPQQVAEIRDLILSLKGERTVVLSSHILTEVQAVCEKVIVMNSGKIMTVETISGLQSQITGSGVLRVRIKNPKPNGMERVASVKGVGGVSELTKDTLEISFDGSEDTVAEVASTIVSAQMGLLELSRKEQQLESIFLNLLKEGEDKTKEAGVLQ